MNNLNNFTAFKMNTESSNQIKGGLSRAERYALRRARRAAANASRPPVFSSDDTTGVFDAYARRGRDGVTKWIMD